MNYVLFDYTPIKKIILFENISSNIVTIIQTNMPEIDKVLLQIVNSFSVSIPSLNDRYIIQPNLDLDISGNFETTKFFVQTKHFINDSVNSERQVILKPKNNALDLTANTIAQSFGNFANLAISKISFEPVSTFAGFTFSDPASLGSVIKNVKVSGTITVSGNTIIGTNTLFTEEFIANEFVIVDNSEKFIINNISNNSFMTINLPASGSYTDVLAYKENL
jgi:hypothetical protein